MSKFLWNIQSIFYQGFRRNPVSARILKEENQSIQVLLKMIPKMDIKTILDIGTGRGNSLKVLKIFDAKTVALDYSHSMIKKTHPSFPDISFIQADIHLIPFQNKSFNLVNCIGVMEYVEDLKTALEEICSALKTGGYVVLSISSLYIFNFLRNLIGHRIFIRNPEILMQLLKEMNLEIICEARTRLQIQYLLKKMTNFETYN